MCVKRGQNLLNCPIEKSIFNLNEKWRGDGMKSLKDWRPVSIARLFPVVMLALLVACGGGGGGSNSATGSSNPSEATNPDLTEVTADLPVWDAAAFTNVYDIGPGQSYETPSDFPWESLPPSSLVRIHYRSTPYSDKWLITTTATEDAPVVVLGIADGSGNKPVISGDGAVTRSSLYYLNQSRSVIKVGNYTGSNDNDRPAYIVLQNLDIRSGRLAYGYTSTSGTIQNYASNAAAVHVEEGDHITIQGCTLRDSGNGLFSGHLSSNLVVRANYIYDNGISDSYYEHNSYTESDGILFEYNHYGPLRDNCEGNNLKDRSAGTVIRYNWIEAGNRQLDLVDSDYESFYNGAGYHATYVYGNVLVEPNDAGNSQIVHYGGDSGTTDRYRKGTLYFYHNTVVSTRSSNTTLLRLSTNDEEAVVMNNLIYASGGGSYLAILNSSGQVELSGNWLSSNWKETHQSALDSGASLNAADNTSGSNPYFNNESSQDYSLTAASTARDAGLTLPDGLTPPEYEYVPHLQLDERMDNGQPDSGAFAY